MIPNHKPYDVTGKRIKVGDVVRIIGVPDYKNWSRVFRRESLPVFKYLVGKYKIVDEIDQYGLVGIWFRKRMGDKLERHWVALEPYLLRIRRKRGK